MAAAPDTETSKSSSSTERKSESSTSPSSDLSSCSCGPDPETSLPLSDTPPTQADLSACADLPILDADGNSRPFKSLYADGGRHLIIFIRHFFCASCQNYIQALTTSLPPTTLSSLPTPTTLTLISSGHPSLIPRYLRQTRCPYALYVDPTRRLFSALSLGRTLSLGDKKPEYITQSLAGIVVAGLVQGIGAGPRGAWRGGDFSQVGGEFLIEGGGVVWGHRMRSTRDHAEVRVLRGVLGVQEGEEEGKGEKEGRRRSSVFGRLGKRESRSPKAKGRGSGSGTQVVCETLEEERRQMGLAEREMAVA